MGINCRARSPLAKPSHNPHGIQQASVTAPSRRLLPNYSAGGTLGTAPESVQGSFQDSGVAITSPAEFSPNPVYAETVVDAMATQRPLQPRQKRQDWCRWPVCEGYLKSGVCPNEKGPGCEGATCNLAHIRSDEASSVTADGYIRVCFDSMGLLQGGCRRAKCSFFHPPTHIKEQIVNKRHAQYLKEKHAKLNRAALTLPTIQVAPQPLLNPYIDYVAILSNLNAAQPILYNNMMVSDLLQQARPLTAAPAPSAQIYPQVLAQPPALIPGMNWPEVAPVLNVPQNLVNMYQLMGMPQQQQQQQGLPPNPMFYGNLAPMPTFAYQPQAMMAVAAPSPVATMAPAAVQSGAVPTAPINPGNSN